MLATKICTQCKKEKFLCEFYTDPNKKDGYGSECKGCNKKRKKEYRRINLSKVREQDSIRYKKDKPKRLDLVHKIYQKNRTKILVQKKEYRATKRHKLLVKKWYKNNRDRYKKYHLKSYSKIENKIKKSISRRISMALEKNKQTKHWSEYFSYSFSDLKKHLEKQFQEGMSWDNYGFYGWHIDHIVPHCSFNYSSYDDEDFKKCWSLDNLQPLWAKDNYAKGGRLLSTEKI